MIISFSGLPGSGKSTIAKKLAEKLGWPRYYMGGIRRQKAKDRGMTLAEYNKLGETDPSTDNEVDEYQKKLGETEDNFVIEGRTSWIFIPRSLKIFLAVDEMIGAQRIFDQLKKENHRNEDKDINTLEDLIASQRKRMGSDRLRYKKYYGIDVFEEKNYDFVLDTSHLTREEVLEKIYHFVESKMA
ncbi:MAG: cytidylate kinase family protein [Patescibacteria group bacterium]|jgi:predicted cytidylate kinase